jgi:hypothetical protein
MAAIEDEILEFFTRYGEGWNAADAQLLSAFFVVPALIATKRSTTFYETGPELLAHIEGLIQSYAAQGVMQRTLLNCDVSRLSENAAHVRLRWRLSGSGDKAMLVAPTSYTLTRDGGVWGIVAVDLRPHAVEVVEDS